MMDHVNIFYLLEQCDRRLFFKGDSSHPLYHLASKAQSFARQKLNTKRFNLSTCSLRKHQKISSSDLIIETVKIKHLMEFKDYKSFSDVYNLKIILLQVNCDAAFRALLTCPKKAVVLNKKKLWYQF